MSASTCSRTCPRNFHPTIAARCVLASLDGSADDERHVPISPEADLQLDALDLTLRLEVTGNERQTIDLDDVLREYENR
jgi:hypothetical protein